MTSLSNRCVLLLFTFTLACTELSIRFNGVHPCAVIPDYLLLAYGFTSVGSQADNTTIRCRSCGNARTLDDCTRHVTCGPNEKCYTDEIITTDLHTVFDAGCRSTQTCQTSPRVGRAVNDGLIACTRCCSAPPQNSNSSQSDMECNTMLCGLKSVYNTTLRCRSCVNARTLDDCTRHVTCGPNEKCYTDEIITTDLHTVFDAGCRSTQTCQTSPRVGRAVNDGLIACTRCCSAQPQNSNSSQSDMECNAMLCGLKSADNTTMRCRSCVNARTLDDCTRHVTCGPNEKCYTDEIITPDLHTVFDAGCRSTQSVLMYQPQFVFFAYLLGDIRVTCQTSPRVGRAVNDGLIACTRCCSAPPQNSNSSHSDMECNAMLCGLNSGLSCYHCQNHQGTASHPNQCYNKTVCLRDEVCRVTTSNIGGTTTHSFGCYNKLKCQLLNKVALIQYGPPSIDLGLSNGIGRKRQSIVCDVCCGENFCNNAECHIVRERLIGYANASRLDYDTLRLKP